jgi:hypothetical protein
MNKSKKTTAFLIAAVLILVASLSALTVSAGGTATVSLADFEANRGSTIKAPLMLYNVTDVVGGELNISFDSSVVHVTGVSDGEIGATTPNINNEAGWAYMNVMAIEGKNGDVVFAYLNLTAVGRERDNSPLNISVISFFDTNYTDILCNTDNGTFGITKTPNASNIPPYKPSNPSPSDGAINISIDADLSWTDGDPDVGDTVTYNVYFGTNTTPPLVSENQSETTYDPGILNYRTQYYWKVAAKDTHGASNESEVWEFTTASAPGSGLVGLWHFDEGNGVIAVDSSGNGNNGTLVNGPIWIDGKLGKALRFDGIDDYVDLPIMNDTSAYTLEMWIYADALGGFLFANDAGATGKSSASTDTWYTRIDGGVTRDDMALPLLPTGDWTYLAFTYDGVTDVKQIYKNGVAVTTKTPTSHGAGALDLDSATANMIGNSNEGSNFNGEIDEVRIYNRALSAEEILAHYQEDEGNRAPELDSIGDKLVNEGQTLTFTITATDPDGDPLTYSASNLPEGANLDPSSRTFSWTPGHEQAGTYPNVHFEVTDGDLTDYEDITITVAGAPTGTISGTVKDKATGNPLEGATVFANSYSATTNSTGGYTITLPGGTYPVTASKTGYFPKSRKRVKVSEDRTTTVNFRLTK